MKIVWEVLCFVILLGPTGWELNNDKLGDFNKTEDVYWRTVIMTAVAVPAAIIGRNYFAAVLVSFAMHFFIFDYAIAYRLINKKIIEWKEAHWFSWLGKKGPIDNLPIWRRMKPGLRFAIRSTVLLISISIYFRWLTSLINIFIK